MTPEQINALGLSASARPREVTHWKGCEVEHPQCAVVALVAEVKRLKAKMEPPEHGGNCYCECPGMETP
jgi:hypothetical protein